ncbi:MAG: altronate dehydratase family protein [Defluviitaleaceae bacterium]|nr:altronate dehydratase family protein [Defluviitaleaceae bacterium]
MKIHEKDNVAVAITPINPGETLAGIPAAEAIPAGHKMALAAIRNGENVMKYGFPIGRATQEIAPGQHVHSHNLKTNLRGLEDYSFTPASQPPASLPATRTFQGYRRSCGKVGIRNEIWIINTVGCVNKIAERLVAETNVPGVHTFVHPYGCSQLGCDHVFTQRLLANLVHHPNAAGVLVLGLGCENNHIETFKETLGTWDANRVKFLNTQDVQDEIAEGLKTLEELGQYASGFRRESIPVGELIVGLKCGGSDGLSGITANPLVGSFSNRLTAHGGISLLTEVPEMFGAETLLMNRCTSEAVFGKTVELINGFKQYFISHNQEIYENPSPGNKKGGITTLEEKSLGCTQKGGSSYVTDVLGQNETAKNPGLNLLNGPGNDIVAVTNLTAAGAHLILFTTGRGTPLGAPVPTVKISSNTALATAKPHWTDFDAGVLAAGEAMDSLAEEFFDYIIEVAEGQETKNEANSYREISIFKDGVIL